MNEKAFGQKIAVFRREKGLTQEGLAELLRVSAQAVSKWENGHSLPETALLPELARALDASLDTLFDQSDLYIRSALYGDGMGAADVRGRVARLVERNQLFLTVCDPILGVTTDPERAPYLVIGYVTPQGEGWAVGREGEELRITSEDSGPQAPAEGLRILAGSYGTRTDPRDVMQKIRHYEFFGWDGYAANQEIFPSPPGNDATDTLTLVYQNAQGVYMATCKEGERLAYSGDHAYLERKEPSTERFLTGVPQLPPFGEGMECSWGAALTVALQGMGADTSYEEVMGESGACYRLAFHSPTWDYSSVDGLVTFDYALPGYAAQGYTPVMFGHIEKGERAEHRRRILREIDQGMPVLGINLRVAPEWGVICGYSEDGAKLYCRTKYDRQTQENDPEFMRGRPPFVADPRVPDGYMEVDQWPFLLCYFGERRKAPSKRERLLESLRILQACLQAKPEGGYIQGLEAYDRWAQDLLDASFYAAADEETLARRFSVNQFCVLSLADARDTAVRYLEQSRALLLDAERGAMEKIIESYRASSEHARRLRRMLDAGKELDGAETRVFWAEGMRKEQAELLKAMKALEEQAMGYAAQIVM